MAMISKNGYGYGYYSIHPVPALRPSLLVVTSVEGDTFSSKLLVQIEVTVVVATVVVLLGRWLTRWGDGVSLWGDGGVQL